MKLPDSLPKGWEIVSLKKIITYGLQNGYSPNCPKKPNGWWILGLGNLTENGFDPTKAKPAPIGDDKVKDFQLKNGDFLISRSNTLDKVGRTILYRGELKNCSYPDLLMRFRINEQQVSKDYLDIFLKTSLVRRYIQGCASGTSSTMVKINKQIVEKIPIVVPPLSDQKNIANIFSSWDEVIEKNEKLIAAKVRKFTGLLDKLIYWPNKIGSWQEVRAEKIFRDRRETNRDDLPLLSITGKEGIIPREETNRKDTSNSDKSKYLRICPGDIGYNTMRMWQGVSALSNLEGIVSPAYTICIPNEKLYPTFVAYLFKTPFMIHRFYRYSQGLTSDTWNLKFRHFREVKMPLPKLNTQIRIAKILDTAQQEINILKQLNERYKIQKRGLMQKLLTGEWRIKPEIVNKYKES